MTTLLLVRHGITDAVGRTIAGRAPGVSLNADGRAQAGLLAERLAGVPLAAVVSSPLERAVETAAPIAAARGLPVETDAALTEIDFGGWTGLTLQALDARADWQRFNAARSMAAPPGGEMMLAVQQRAMACLLRLSVRFPQQPVAVVSHADVIRAVLLYCLGMPLDLVHRLEVLPGRISVVGLTHGVPVVRQVNGDTATLLA